MDKISGMAPFSFETVSGHVEMNDSPISGVALFALSMLTAFFIKRSIPLLTGPEDLRRPARLEGLPESNLIPGLSEYNPTIKCLSFLETADLGKACSVSKVWKGVLDHSLEGQLLWKQASIMEGVPVVEGKRQDYKGDFKFLRPITISSRVIGRYLGEVVGEVPRMSEGRFLQLRNAEDPFEPGKLLKETSLVLVDPSTLKIKVGPNRPLTLNANGTLEEVPAGERGEIIPMELTIPFSLNNLKMLTSYPLTRVGTGLIFGRNAYIECNTFPNQNEILIMRREVVGKNRPFNGEDGQNALVTNQGWEVMRVRERGLYDAINILKTGTCPDNRVSWIYARTSESTNLNGVDYNAVIGLYSPEIGMNLHYDKPFPHGFIGVVPGISAGI